MSKRNNKTSRYSNGRSAVKWSNAVIGAWESIFPEYKYYYWKNNFNGAFIHTVISAENREILFPNKAWPYVYSLRTETGDVAEQRWDPMDGRDSGTCVRRCWHVLEKVTLERSG